MKAAILDILYENRGEYVSGEEISSRLGVSRMAVKKHVDDLRARGYEISSAKRSGHRLDFLGDVFDEVSLTMFLRRKGLDLPVLFFGARTPPIPVQKVLPSGKRFVAAAQQQGGRGRLGRSFVSGPGGVYFTYYCRPKGLSPMDALKAVFCAALAVRSALREYTDCAIKWTNDIYAGDKKVCGILCEMVSDSDSVQYLIQGIGINVNNEIEEDLEEKAASLKQLTGKTLNRAEICAEVVCRLERYNGLLFSGRFGEALSEYKMHCLTLGRRVAVEGTQGFEGIAEDIDENGFLIVKTSSGSRKVISGDVSTIW